MYPSSNGLTAAQIAERLRINPKRVIEKPGIDKYIVGTLPTGGRPATLYSPQCIAALWPNAIRRETVERKRHTVRADKGGNRKETPEEWRTIRDRVFSLYMANAQKNLKLACEEAAKQLKREGMDIRRNIYKRLTKKDLDTHGFFISEYYRDNWPALHTDEWRRKEQAIKEVVIRYDWLPTLESAGLCGLGFGAHRIWGIDVRHNDVWARTDDTGEALLPAAVYIFDGLSGFPLHVEPIETESATAIIRAVLNCMLRWGRLPDLCVSLDNGSAMIAERTRKVLATILPDTAWNVAEKYPALFQRRSGWSDRDDDPRFRLNLPNIPQSPFKAQTERSFKRIKDEFDATRFPRLYQGGSRDESVQLTLSNKPVLPAAMLTVNGYFANQWEWLLSDYIKRDRPDSFPLFVERGLAPTIYDVFEFYGGFNDATNLPEGDRIAHVVYWATEADDRIRCTAQYGAVEYQRGNKLYRWVSGKLDHRFVGKKKKIVVLPLPGHDIAFLMYIGDPENPQYLGTATKGRISHIDDFSTVPADVRAARAEIKAARRDARDARDASVTWHNHHDPVALPNPTVDASRMLGPGPAEPDVTPEPAEPPRISNEGAEFLRDIEDLLDDE